MNILVFLFMLELGIMPDNVIMGYDSAIPERFEKIGYYATLESGLMIYDLLYVKGMIRTEMQKENHALNFVPNLSFYGIEAGLKYKIFSAGIRRLCAHPVIPYVYKTLDKPNFDTSYSEIFIRIESP